MKEEKPLSEKMKELFEIEYLDSMADVQGDVKVLVANAVERLKEAILDNNDDGIQFNEFVVDEIFGDLK